MVQASAIESDAGTAWVIARLLRPYDPARVAAGLLGLPLGAGRQLVGGVLATSDEAEDLLEAIPRIFRSMAVSTTDRPERCHGELRGPVLWSETMSARSASAGDPGLFMCATTSRAYDTVENRVLKAALVAIESAGRDAQFGTALAGEPVVRRARHNQARARRYLEHQTISGVPLSRITGRDMRRTRAGHRRHTYDPAIAMMIRLREPLRAPHLEAYAPRALARQHDLLAATLHALDDRTDERLPLRCDGEGLVCGPLRYSHREGVTLQGAVIADAGDIHAAIGRWVS